MQNVSIGHALHAVDELGLIGRVSFFRPIAPQNKNSFKGSIHFFYKLRREFLHKSPPSKCLETWETYKEGEEVLTPLLINRLHEYIQIG